MTQITVQSFKINPSGKSGVIKAADGHDYLYKANQHHFLANGMTFEVAVQESSFNGKINKWIDGKWTAAPQQTPSMQSGTQPPNPSNPNYAAQGPAPATMPRYQNEEDIKSRRIFVTGVVQQAMGTGKFAASEISILVEEALRAWKAHGL